MKVITLLKTLCQVDYVLVSESGYTLEEGYIDEWSYRHNDYITTDYKDCKVLKIGTVKDKDTLFITIR